MNKQIGRLTNKRKLAGGYTATIKFFPIDQKQAHAAGQLTLADMRKAGK